MEPFTKLVSKAVPLVRDDVDTDQIIPARFLKVTSKLGLGKLLFNDWRYEADGSPKPSFVLNRPEFAGRKMLLAGDNFGCGSSREHAPWALTDWGFKAIFARSFADIFRNNALKNGLLPIAVKDSEHQMLCQRIEAAPDTSIEVDLERQEVAVASDVIRFDIDPFAKKCLLLGMDQLDYLASHHAAIAAFESRQLSR